MTFDDREAEPMEMLATLASAGLVVPPTGDTDLRDITKIGPWNWASTDRVGHLDADDDLYMFRVETVLERLLEGGAVFDLCHAGHGMNSYGLNLVTTSGPIAAFIQHGWGGVYMDPLRQRFRINATYSRLHELFGRIAEPDAPLRWVLLYSEFRGVCGVVDLVAYGSGRSLDEAYLSSLSKPAIDRDDASLFEDLAAQPGLLNPPFSGEPAWRFSED